MDLTVSIRNRPLFVLDGYKFRYQKSLKNNLERWSCTIRECKAYLKLVPPLPGESSPHIAAGKPIHNHNKIDDKVARRKEISRKIQTIAEMDFTSRPAEIIESLLDERDWERFTPHDINLIRRNLYNRRVKAFKSLSPDDNELLDLSVSKIHLIIF